MYGSLPVSEAYCPSRVPSDMNIWWNNSFRLEHPDTEVDADAGL